MLDGNRLQRVRDEEIINGTFTIPSKASVINEGTFKHLPNLKTIIIPDSVYSIGVGAFYDCQNLESVTLPKNLKLIAHSLFKNCSNLKNVNIPSTVNNINFSAFEGCSSLESISIPFGLKDINDSAFAGCSSLKKVNLPPSVRRIHHSAFSDCTNLQNIKISRNVKDIDELAFSNCKSLKNIHFPNKTIRILDESFKGCDSLEKINLPKNLVRLGKGSFMDCSNLASVSIPKSLKTIEASSFENCSNLTKVKFSNGLIYINLRAFANCTSLTDISLPNSLEVLSESTFENCTSLKNIKLSKSLKNIFPRCFKNCTSLETIVLPENVSAIKGRAFEGCSSLRSINIPEKITIIGKEIFEGCYNLEEVNFPVKAKSIKGVGNSSLKFFNKNLDGDGFSLTSYANKDSIPLDEIKVDLAFLSNHWEYKDTILKEQKNPNICDLYNTFLLDRGSVLAENLLKSHNFTFLKKFDLSNSMDNKTPFYLMLFNLGALSTPKEINGKKYDYAQKVSEFLLERLNKKQITINGLCDSFRYMSLTGFKKDFTDFFLSNFDELMAQENKRKGFIAKCYNEFEDVQKTNTSNRGSQRQLKPTVQKFKDYFETSMFNNVTSENMEIARTISPYFNDQGTFNLAIGIDKIRKDENVPNNILSAPLKETLEDTKNLPFASIDKMARKIGNSATRSLDELIKTANNEFTFEWLEKNDPKNFILGKLCSCCAHLEGMGFGIMHASIVHPTIQNLVIKDSNGEIIAKSTLYLNKEKGYGVFNNVEVSADILPDKKQKIYEKYILGVKRFIEEYNKENPDNPLMQVNVGMNLNDLSRELIFNHEYELKPNLKAINYAEYGTGALAHSGDSEDEQCIIWKSDKLKENSPKTTTKNQQTVQEKQ